MRRLVHHARRAVLSAAIIALAVACGGNGGALADVLPESGELGAGWERVSDPRTGDAAESSSLCASGLDDAMVEGAKIDLARGEDFASTYFRRYPDLETASTAFKDAANRIAGCGSAEDFAVLTVPPPMAGDDAFSALFSAPGTDPAVAGDFGWTLVRTGDVIRSLQFIPAAGAADLEIELRGLTDGLVAPG